jgi:hypothetical protein
MQYSRIKFKIKLSHNSLLIYVIMYFHVTTVNHENHLNKILTIYVAIKLFKYYIIK